MTTSSVTRIDSVLTELASLATTAFTTLAGTDDEIEVMDGPKIGELPWRHLVLGLTDSPDIPPYVTHLEQQPGLGAPRYIERFEIRCSLCLADGSNDVASLRSEMVTVLGLLADELNTNHRKTGVWNEIGWSEQEMTWYPVPNQDGATVLVFFTIEGASLL